MECANLKDKFYARPLNFFKIARSSFGMIIFRGLITPSLQINAFDLHFW